MGSYYLLIILISLASIWVSNTLKRKFKTYSKLQLRNGMSGKEIAEQMLADHGIRDVEVISVRGSLTDHYNPQKKTINLSESVYNERNAAAAAVAAHECGHAVQHATAYSWLQLRSNLVPMVNVASQLSSIKDTFGETLTNKGIDLDKILSELTARIKVAVRNEAKVEVTKLLDKFKKRYELNL